MKVAMISIHVDDPAQAYTFYTETLGFEPFYSMPEMYLYIVRGEGADSPAILLEPSNNPIVAPYRQGLRDQGIPAMVFSVTDLDSEVARLEAAGVEFIGDETSDPNGRYRVFDDTCGNYIQLMEPTVTPAP